MRLIDWRAGAVAGAMVFGLLAAPARASTAAEQALVETASTLGAGQFTWSAAVAPAGPVSVVISIPLQRLFVYRGTSLIAVSAVSTGKPGHETPVGEYVILQKAVSHRSNKYNDASMPYMQRLTWDGVAIHAGRDPGYSASHGCVRVPLAFARRLYAITRLGARVSVTADATAPGVPDGFMPLPTPVVQDVAATDADASATRLANLAAR